MQKFFISNFEVGEPSILFLWEISYRFANMLSVQSLGQNGTQKLSNAKQDARDFLKNFRCVFRFISLQKKSHDELSQPILRQALPRFMRKCLSLPTSATRFSLFKYRSQ